MPLGSLRKRCETVVRSQPSFVGHGPAVRVVSIKPTTDVYRQNNTGAEWAFWLALGHDRRSFAFTDAANHPHRDESRKQRNENLFHVNPQLE